MTRLDRIEAEVTNHGSRGLMDHDDDLWLIKIIRQAEKALLAIQVFTEDLGTHGFYCREFCEPDAVDEAEELVTAAIKKIQEG